MNIAFNPKDTNTFASACLDRTVKIKICYFQDQSMGLGLKQWKNIQVYAGHTHYVMNITFNPKGTNMYICIVDTVCLNRTVKIKTCYFKISSNPDYVAQWMSPTLYMVFYHLHKLTDSGQVRETNLSVQSLLVNPTPLSSANILITSSIVLVSSASESPIRSHSVGPRVLTLPLPNPCRHSSPRHTN